MFFNEKGEKFKEATSDLMGFLLGNKGKHIDELARGFYATRMRLKGGK